MFFLQKLWCNRKVLWNHTDHQRTFKEPLFRTEFRTFNVLNKSNLLLLMHSRETVSKLERLPSGQNFNSRRSREQLVPGSEFPLHQENSNMCKKVFEQSWQSSQVCSGCLANVCFFYTSNRPTSQCLLVYVRFGWLNVLRLRAGQAQSFTLRDLTVNTALFEIFSTNSAHIFCLNTQIHFNV